jgi:hypothetical protein
LSGRPKNAAQDRATCDGNDPGSGSFREPAPSASPAHAVIEAAGYALFAVGQDGRMRWATPNAARLLAGLRTPDILQALAAAETATLPLTTGQTPEIRQVGRADAA